ncbi:gluconokinase [Tanticharoenia sakaeratensis]|jgi:gluconokinase|uniref:Gluconokinase n=1 Tax=Tanticharoenia sakaeratensis NBRC 103193 TaxID=1231623 RepID=A0A0D6MKS8_9PROT|nr:gluconokinase [Tanticharoenia sakaeratensis]GAN54086.1 thermosensitive gluconokinase [Tanticharoenia sakaeratensis NBRC 103193]GBQ24745.1 gluconokinase [Tanticharoenia sakaeratensis NBRC 103193]
MSINAAQASGPHASTLERPGPVPDADPTSVPLVTPSRRLREGLVRPTILIVMGVSGCGKSTLADALAARLKCARLEGDDLHPANNIAKMSAGIPLTDEDRWPWLEDIAHRIRTWSEAKQSGVITCSALKRAYRDILAGGLSSVCFVYLKGTKAQILPRLSHRTGHFMPTSMLDSQFAALEEPAQDEIEMDLDVTAEVPALCDAVIACLERLPAP